jgi:hypothetical protein
MNKLLPLYANKDWSGLIPASVAYSESSILYEFTADSTRTPIQSLRLIVDTFCCSGDGVGACGESSSNEGSLHFTVRVDVKDRSRWMTTTLSSCIYDNVDFGCRCKTRMQFNKCKGVYDTFIDDVDFYQQLLKWDGLALQKSGSLDQHDFRKVIIDDINICKTDEGIVGIGLNVLISLIT